MLRRFVFFMIAIISGLMLLISCSNSNIISGYSDDASVAIGEDSVDIEEDNVEVAEIGTDRAIGEKYPSKSTSNCYPYSKSTWGTATWPKGV
ncbi:MAG TPA: hypothetical protein PK385_12270, partial [Spirochaetota bacterium]|nr:hypothetical protein [Spirochaetota bacterium]HOS34116.1 hypothetical protein [Spirochaetota bacterium]HOS56819.1 hypothetical protein [Spirochaetota bacterium]HQF79061.1 hypothetical protein [Spirochaetota bacterium]HQH29836.1 hypothetical protein [Spirochaetota bacterium]